MRLLIAILLLSGFAIASGQPRNSSTQLTLLPVPAAIQLQQGRRQLDNSFTIAIFGEPDPRLEHAVTRLQERIAGRIGIELPVGISQDSQTAKLTIQYQSRGLEIPQLGEDESYSLTIDARHAILHANTVVGALRGLQTVLQLVSAGQDGYFLPLVNIQDKPRFPWRGLMIDVSRHFEPVEVIKRNIDGLATVKMNVFHWHLTDDQGFRVESRRYPKLTGSGSDGLYYTQEQVREVIAYAADRGIRVVPEFDMPGHTTSWFIGYPELASGPGPYQIERQFGIFDPVMDPTRESTYSFLDNFLGEMAQLFPDDYVHIGGDENNGKQWQANPQIQHFMREHGLKDTAAMQAYFNQRVFKILQKHGKKMIGWDEVLTPDLPKEVVVQSWRGTQSLAEGAKLGYRGVLSQPYYLDHMETAEFHYLADPVPAGSDLTPEQAERILGGEACAWGEYLSPENIDSRIWPRTAAVAERLWSSRDVRDVADMYRRLDPLSVALEQDGLTHLSSTTKMLRQIAGVQDIGALGTLSQVVSPSDIGTRENLEKDNQFTPLTGMTDAVIPDPPFRRHFTTLVHQLLSDEPSFSAARPELTQIFEQWQALPKGFQVKEAAAPILRPAESRVRELAELGRGGLQALTYLHSGQDAPAAWKQAQLALASEAAKPDKSLLELPWLPAYRALVLAAAQVGNLKTMTPQQWKQLINSAAQPQVPQQ